MPPVILAAESGTSQAWGRPALPAFTLFAVLAAALAALAPLPLTFASVWLFAGPHNWMEARYFLARLPSRWTVRRGFLVAGAGGTVLLGAAFALLPVTPVWFTLGGFWVLLLVRLAGRDAGEAAGPVCAAVALAWWDVSAACLLLLYLHPIAALYFLFRQAGKRWPDVRRFPFAMALAVMGVTVAALRWSSLGPGADWSAGAITALPSQPGLIALHAYLELLHYGVWVLALPAIGMAARPWQWRAIPLARRWPHAVAFVIAAGAIAVVALWLGMAIDQDRVRAAYFTIAIFHVLAEVPMMLWLR